MFLSRRQGPLEVLDLAGVLRCILHHLDERLDEAFEFSLELEFLVLIAFDLLCGHARRQRRDLRFELFELLGFRLDLFRNFLFEFGLLHLLQFGLQLAMASRGSLRLVSRFDNVESASIASARCFSARSFSSRSFSSRSLSSAAVCAAAWPLKTK